LGRARELAQKFSAEAVLLSEIPEQLIHADIVVTSTASQLPILGKGAVEHALKLRKHRPMLMVDIAVPRDIEAQVGELRDVYLYSVDDLRDIVDQNLRGRQTEARKADVIIAEGVVSHQEAERSLAAVDTVKEYRMVADKLREEELQRALRLLSRGENPEQVLAQLARGLTQKLIHAPSAGLRKISAAGRDDLMHTARKLLGLPASAQADENDGNEQTSSQSKEENTEPEQTAFSSSPRDPSEQTLQ
jgi:glutamyl-tRNA reductase